MTKEYKKLEILVDVYGNRSPRAAQAFGGAGVHTIEEITEATLARRNAVPVEYDHNSD